MEQAQSNKYSLEGQYKKQSQSRIKRFSVVADGKIRILNIKIIKHSTSNRKNGTQIPNYIL